MVPFVVTPLIEHTAGLLYGSVMSPPDHIHVPIVAVGIVVPVINVIASMGLSLGDVIVICAGIGFWLLITGHVKLIVGGNFAICVVIFPFTSTHLNPTVCTISQVKSSSGSSAIPYVAKSKSQGNNHNES